MAARSPARSSTGPEVDLMLTPISWAMMFASVVLPSPGGPQKRTWSRASPLPFAASMKTRRLSLIRSCPTKSSKRSGRREWSSVTSSLSCSEEMMRLDKNAPQNQESVARSQEDDLCDSFFILNSGSSLLTSCLSFHQLPQRVPDEGFHSRAGAAALDFFQDLFGERFLISEVHERGDRVLDVPAGNAPAFRAPAFRRVLHFVLQFENEPRAGPDHRGPQGVGDVGGGQELHDPEQQRVGRRDGSRRRDQRRGRRGGREHHEVLRPGPECWRHQRQG